MLLERVRQLSWEQNEESVKNTYSSVEDGRHKSHSRPSTAKEQTLFRYNRSQCLQWAQFSCLGYLKKILDLWDKSGKLSKSLEGSRGNQTLLTSLSTSG